jgi:hypothetical protein
MPYRAAPFRTFAPAACDWEDNPGTSWRARTDFLFQLYDVDANGWLTTDEVTKLIQEYDGDPKQRAMHDAALRDALSNTLGLSGRVSADGFEAAVRTVPYLVDMSEDIQLALSSVGKNAEAALYALSQFFGVHNIYRVLPEEELMITELEFERQQSVLMHAIRRRQGSTGSLGDADVDPARASSAAGSSPPLRMDMRPMDRAARAAAPSGGSGAGHAERAMRRTHSVENASPAPPAVDAAVRRSSSLCSLDTEEVRPPQTAAEEKEAAAAFALLRAGRGEDVENMILFGAVAPTVAAPDGGSLLHALLRSPWAAKQAGGSGKSDALAQEVHRLLGCGVPPAARDGAGRSAAELAAELGHSQVAWLLDDAVRARRRSPCGAGC